MASKQLKEYLKGNCLGRDHAMKAAELEQARSAKTNCAVR